MRWISGLLGLILVLTLSWDAVQAQTLEPVRLRVEITDGGFNGQPGLRLEVDQDRVVELTFVFAQTRSIDDQHIIALRGYGLETNVIDFDHRESTLRFVANRPGTFELLCQLDCEIHRRLEGGQLVVNRGAPPVTEGAVRAIAPVEATAERVAETPAQESTSADNQPADTEPISTEPITEAASAGPPILGEPVTRVLLIPTRLTVEPSAWQISEGSVDLGATLADADGAGIRRATIRFFVEADFAGMRGPMEIASVRTDDRGSAQVSYRPTWEGPHLVTARFEGLGLYAESEQSLRLQVDSAAPAYSVAPRGMEPVSQRLPAVVAAVLIGIWSTFGYVLYLVVRIKRAGLDLVLIEGLNNPGGSLPERKEPY